MKNVIYIIGGLGLFVIIIYAIGGALSAVDNFFERTPWYVEMLLPILIGIFIWKVILKGK